MWLRGVGHSFGPDVEAPPPFGRNLPGTPDALALVETLIEDVVLGEVTLRPVATAVGHIITAPDDEMADVITAFAGHATLGKGEVKLHLMAAGNGWLKEETGP